MTSLPTVIPFNPSHIFSSVILITNYFPSLTQGTTVNRASEKVPTFKKLRARNIYSSLTAFIISGYSRNSIVITGFFFKVFIYLVFAVLDLGCCMQVFSSCGEWGSSSLQGLGFSFHRRLLLWRTGFSHVGFCSCSIWTQQLWH